MQHHLIRGWSWHFPRLWRPLTHLIVNWSKHGIHQFRDRLTQVLQRQKRCRKTGFSLQICFIANVSDMHLPVNTVFGEPHLNSLQAEAVPLDLPRYFLLVMWTEIAVLNLPCPSFQTAKGLHKMCFPDIEARKYYEAEETKSHRDKHQKFA